jgi:quercetin dioxygenase-like cupin family protein
MQVVRKRPVFKDSRGEITDIFEGSKFDCLTILTNAKGAVRGNHYHKATTQYTFILEGRFRLYSQAPGGKVATRIVKPGDLVISPPRERHAFRALEDSKLLAFCTGPRAGRQYETDTFKLDIPISGPAQPVPAGKGRGRGKR